MTTTPTIKQGSSLTFQFGSDTIEWRAAEDLSYDRAMQTIQRIVAVYTAEDAS